MGSEPPLPKSRRGGTESCLRGCARRARSTREILSRPHESSLQVVIIASFLVPARLVRSAILFSYNVNCYVGQSLAVSLQSIHGQSVPDQCNSAVSGSVRKLLKKASSQSGGLQAD